MSDGRLISILERSGAAVVLSPPLGASTVPSIDRACFGYQICPTSEGWAWTTYNLDGTVNDEGRAPEKALAAAMVIRALARSAGETRSNAAA